MAKYDAIFEGRLPAAMVRHLVSRQRLKRRRLAARARSAALPLRLAMLKKWYGVALHG